MSQPVIPVAHDFICSWCWIGLSQVRRLRSEFAVGIDWLGYELQPEELDWPEPAERPQVLTSRPKIPTRLELAYAAEGMEMPTVERPKRMRTHNAHEAVEYAKTEGVADELVERLYRAYWQEGQNIGEISVLEELAGGIVRDVPGMISAVRERRFAARITAFNEPAYAKGVYNLPTYFIEEERYSEQPYRVIRVAIAEMLGAEPTIYAGLRFPSPPEDRPYVFINMVSTIDGKTVTGSREEPVQDLGSKLDHQVMRKLEEQAHAVMIGAGTLRATPKLWYPERLVRIVVTRSGELDFSGRFFTDAPSQAFVIGPTSLETPEGVRLLPEDLSEAMKVLKRKHGIHRLLVEGGSELNAEVLSRELADELFLTLAPKIKLGRETPTYAGGDPLPRERIQNYSLLERHQVGDELFLRYRRTDAK